MKRLDEIKERLQSMTDPYVDNCEFVADMEYLLSLNERYKEALAYIADRENCYEDLPAKAAKALEE